MSTLSTIQENTHTHTHTYVRKYNIYSIGEKETVHGKIIIYINKLCSFM